MTHAPPVPAGNQSPYPIAEPPHAKSAAPASDASAGKDDGAGSTVTDIVARLPSVEPRTAYIGAIAVVAAGVVGGLFYALTGRKAKTPAKPAPKSSARSAPKSPPKPRRAKAATGTRRKASDAK